MAQTQRSVSPLDNLTYDVLTILHEKAKGMEAYDKYLSDAQGDQNIRALLEQIKQSDSQHIEKLQQELVRLLGKSGQGGKGGKGGIGAAE